MKRFASYLALAGALFVAAPGAAAQSAAVDAAARHLRQNGPALGLDGATVDELVLADAHRSSVSGATHVYFQQAIGGVPVYDAVVNVGVNRFGGILSTSNRSVPNLRASVVSDARQLTASAAIERAAASIGRTVRLDSQRALPGLGERVAFTVAGTGDEASAWLMYVPVFRGGVHLAWVTTVASEDGAHLWQVGVSAATGAVLFTEDLADDDHWAADDHLPEGWAVVAPERADAAPLAEIARLTGVAPVGAPAGAAGQYRVYGGNLESPAHAGDPYADLRTLVSTGGNATASPSGWHSDGLLSYTITRGNNVRAGLDVVAPNGIDLGSEPDGGAGLVFDFAFDPSTQNPDAYRPAAVTNLFYWNNIVHDVSWFYGFDEAAGNFQATNLSGLAAGNDAVLAEAQDYSGTNNANFSTPADGQAPRMQMYVWGTPLVNELAYGTTTASMTGAAFGTPFPTTGLTADIVVVNDGTALPAEGCNALTNAAEVAGKLALAYRGTCGFTVKVKNAQDAGAIGVVIVNNAPGSAITLGGADATVVIPAGMVTDVDGAALVGALPTVATVRNLGQGVLGRDSDFDAGVIVHEYGHGISNRLTGGRLNVSCLSTTYSDGTNTFQSEQMGEGWSDYYALLLTDTNTDGRGIGTYLTFEPTTGQGIRPYRYSTDMSTNPATYDYIKTAAAPHGVGFVWASMVWDMTRNLVGRYGWSPDVYAGSGGNNLALKLVTEGMKLQPCRPGFEDGRDAILAADVAITDGANQCLIWDSFARRGLGFSADQAGYWDKTDGTEAFDLPVVCATSQMGIGAVEAVETLTARQKANLVNKLTKAQQRLNQGRPNNALYILDLFDQTLDAIPARRLPSEAKTTLLEYSDGFRNRILEQYPSAFAEVDPDVELLTGEAPVTFALEQSTPNPTAGTAEIRFALPAAAHVRLTVFDVTGRQVATLADGEFEAGLHTATLDARTLAAGTYVYRIEAGTDVATRRLTVVR